MFLNTNSYSSECFVIGIDVSKFKSDFCILGTDNTVFKRGVVQHNSVSMHAVLKIFEEAEGFYGVNAVCIMEATSYYHRPMYQFLKEHGYTVIVINPIQSGSIKNINIRNMKNDKVDAYRLALLYKLNAIKPSNIPEGIISGLRSICRYHVAMTDDLVRYRSRLVAFIEQSIPGYMTVFSDIIGNASLTVLEKFSSPTAMLNADEVNLTEIIKTASHKQIKYASQKAKQIKAIAIKASEIGVHRQEDNYLIPSIISIIRMLQKNIIGTNNEIKRLFKENEYLAETATLLKTIPGVADFSAAVLISEIGDISTFTNAKQLVAYFRLDPSQHQSGNFSGTRMKLSKRGSPYLRYIINMVAIKNAYKMRNGKCLNPVTAEYYEQKRATKGPKTALCAVMRKMVNVIFAVLRDKKPFEYRTPEEHRQIMCLHASMASKISA